MTTEDDFQRQLDAHPDDHDLRRVFADWLQEQGDPRAEGYRALGVLEVRPGTGLGYLWYYGTVANTSQHEYHASVLPVDWYAEVKTTETRPSNADIPWWAYFNADIPWWAYFNARREADDAAALAFSKLPAESRAELLAVKVLS